jgi:alkylated DNA nucleotide flippase Atl1
MALRQIGTIITTCERFGVPTESIPAHLHSVPVHVNPRLRTVLGKAGFHTRTKEYSIEIHKCVFADPDQMQKTLAHEVAHVIAGISQGHNSRWKAIARRLGHSGERCSTREVAERIGMPKRARRVQRIVARCVRCDYEVIRTRALKRGATFTHIRCGGRIVAID